METYRMKCFLNAKTRCRIQWNSSILQLLDEYEALRISKDYTLATIRIDNLAKQFQNLVVTPKPSINDVKRFIYDVIYENPFFRVYRDDLRLEFIENSSFNGEFNSSTGENILRIDTTKFDLSTGIRSRAIWDLLSTIGHELCHYIQIANMPANSLLHDLSKRATLFNDDFDFLYKESARKDFLNALQYLSNNTSVSYLLRMSSDDEKVKQKTINAFSQTCYYSYPYEMDARIGGAIFADGIMRTLTKNSSMSSEDKERLTREITIHLGSMDRHIYIQFSDEGATPLTFLCKRFDIEKLADLVDKMDHRNKHEKGAITPTQLGDSTFAKYMQAMKNLTRIGEDAFTLFCSFADLDQLSSLFFTLIKSGNPRALYVREYLLKTYNIEIAKQIIPHLDKRNSTELSKLDKKVFSRKKLLALLESNDVTKATFLNIDWAGSDILSEKEKKTLALSLLSQGKLSYLPAIVSDTFDNEFIRQLEHTAERFCDSLQSNSDEFYINDYTSLLNTVAKLESQKVKQIKEKLLSVWDEYNAMVKDPQTLERQYRKIYGDKAFEYKKYTESQDETLVAREAQSIIETFENITKEQESE